MCFNQLRSLTFLMLNVSRARGGHWRGPRLTNPRGQTAARLAGETRRPSPVCTVLPRPGPALSFRWETRSDRDTLLFG